MPAEVLDYVDSKKNCEDIALNMLITAISGAPPAHVQAENVLDYGTYHGISTLTGHGESRSDCINDLGAILGHIPLLERRYSFGHL